VYRQSGRHAASEHGVGASGAQLVHSKFQCVQRRSAGSVESAAAAAQAKRLGQQDGDETGDVTVERGRRFDSGQRSADFLGESASEIGTGQHGNALGRQGDVAEDDTDAATVQAMRDAARERLPAGVQGQVKNGIEFGQSVGRI
jgi:hypothetical protein